MTRALTFREVITVLLRQGGTILCFRCKEPILFPEDAEREHLHEKGLDGDDGVDNARISHVGCHAQITHGNGATWAGSSRHRIAKATKPERIEKFQVNKRPLDADLVGEPSGRCRKCGEYPDACQCGNRLGRPAFRRAR